MGVKLLGIKVKICMGGGGLPVMRGHIRGRVREGPDICYASY